MAEDLPIEYQLLKDVVALDLEVSSTRIAEVEKAGGKVLIHPAPPQNLKVTTPFDLRVAELLLAESARDR